ncbi:hypothetical protein D0962_26045 [Leptolyngbyaceae cyanobacterium CCMR0082]|uniref:Uncharacterized protein n=1 Tax=Adonisia turfae CCMR0082 TaxID=2304604 RepID=A0A6M0SDQ4_9CYAN|nr:hypothetical protein [Adonisia turfae]NEZ66183.1 hypothetical protein [Adonisia turfae CCMR0082]
MLIYAFRKVGVESANTVTSLWAETFTQAYQDLHSPENLRTCCAKTYSNEEAISILSPDQYACIIAYREAAPVGYYILNYQQCPKDYLTVATSPTTH